MLCKVTESLLGSSLNVEKCVEICAGETERVTMPLPCRKLRSKKSGAILVDVVIGMFFLVLTGVSLMSLFPVIKRGEQISKERSRAVQMCNRLLEHVQMLGAKDVTYGNLHSLNLIDDTSQSQPYSFTHVPMDEASRYSPAQALRDADAQISFTNLAGGSIQVNVVLNYTSDTGHQESVRTGTVVGGFR